MDLVAPAVHRDITSAREDTNAAILRSPLRYSVSTLSLKRTGHRHRPSGSSGHWKNLAAWARSPHQSPSGRRFHSIVQSNLHALLSPSFTWRRCSVLEDDAAHRADGILVGLFGHAVAGRPALTLSGSKQPAVYTATVASAAVPTVHIVAQDAVRRSASHWYHRWRRCPASTSLPSPAVPVGLCQHRATGQLQGASWSGLLADGARRAPMTTCGLDGRARGRRTSTSPSFLLRSFSAIVLSPPSCRFGAQKRLARSGSGCCRASRQGSASAGVPSGLPSALPQPGEALRSTLCVPLWTRRQSPLSVGQEFACPAGCALLRVHAIASSAALHRRLRRTWPRGPSSAGSSRPGDSRRSPPVRSRSALYRRIDCGLRCAPRRPVQQLQPGHHFVRVFCPELFQCHRGLSSFVGVAGILPPLFVFAAAGRRGRGSAFAVGMLSGAASRPAASRSCVAACTNIGCARPRWRRSPSRLGIVQQFIREALSPRPLRPVM